MTKTPLVGQQFFGLDLSLIADRFWGLRRQISKRFLLLEFGASSLAFAQASFTEAEVSFTHIRRLELPENAVERGVPSEPSTMALMIKDLCREEKIYAHRAAVVLPPEAAFTKLIEIPAGLTAQQARDYANDPSSGLQIPIPLQQTDFDLVPTILPARTVNGQTVKPYLLTSVPQKLVDQLIETLRQAGLELHSVEIAFASHLRLIAAEVAALGHDELILLLELLPDCTHLSVASASGPLAIDRLTAVREFPQPNVSDQQADASVADALSAKSITLADPAYMAISELDLRVLVKEIKRSLHLFLNSAPHFKIKGVALTGINSAHPTIDELLSDDLDLPVHIIRPLGASGVGNVSLSQLLIHQSLGRLLGLGLGLLPHEALVSCSLSDLADHHTFSSQLLPEAAADPLEESVLLSSAARDEVFELEAVAISVVEEAAEMGDDGEAEEEWPSLKLSFSEDEREEEAEKSTDEGLELEAVAISVVEEAEGMGDDGEAEEDCPSLKLSFSEEERESKDGLGPSIS